MKTRILIVDDEEEFVQVLSERLLIRDYDVTTSLNGEEAMTLEEIGRLLQPTRERVRQLKERALQKLRNPQCYQALMALMDGAEAVYQQ